MNRRRACGAAFQAKAQFFLVLAPAHADNDMTWHVAVYDFNQFIILNWAFGVFGSNVTVRYAERITLSLQPIEVSIHGRFRRHYP